MTDENQLPEANGLTNELINANDRDNPGVYVAAFFMVIKAGDPNIRHGDDRYVREAENSPAGSRQHLGFINCQNFGPNVPTYVTVLYQRPGSSQFNVQLIPVGEENRGRSGTLGEYIWEERTTPTSRTTRHLWALSREQGLSGRPFFVTMDGNRIEISMIEQNGNPAIVSSNGPGWHQSALWKFNNNEQAIKNITMTQLGPVWGAQHDYKINIPTREQILSGNEYRNADFLDIQFNGVALRGCNLPNAKFSRSMLVNVKFDLSLLQGSNFSLNDSWAPFDLTMRDVSFIKADLSSAKFELRPIENCKFDNAILNGTSFKKAYFRNTSFKGADFSKTDFSEVDFNGIVLDGTEVWGHTAATGTIFSKATIPYSMIRKDWAYLDLSETKFTGTILPGTLQATGVKLIGTQLPGANFVDAVFINADLSRANLAGANLTGANFTGANLTGTILTGATLTNAIFTRTTLASAILNKANLTGANFTEAPIFGRTVDSRTRLQEATIPLSFLGTNWSYLDLTKANLLNKDQLPQNLNAAYVILDDVNLHDANLSKAVLNYAQLKNTQLPNANLADVQMNNAVLIGTIFTNADMKQAKMENADITNADFSGAELWGGLATLKGATAVNVSFNHAYLANMDFSDIKGKAMQGCNFANACLVNAKFGGTVLGSYSGKVTSLANAYLQGANFDNADLKTVNLTGASIASVNGKLEATIRSRKDTSIPTVPLTFTPTVIPGGTTSAGTVCPSGDSGPCANQKWTPRNPRPDTWSFRAIRREEEETEN